MYFFTALLCSSYVFEKVRQGYLKIAEKNPHRVVCLDANKSIEELKTEIINKTLEKINASLE